MFISKLLVFISAVVWIIWGAYCFIEPTFLGPMMGYGFDHWSPKVEARAMYGGLEIGLGIYAVMGLVKPKEYLRPNLWCWLLVFGGLVIGRITGLAQWGGTWAVTSDLPAGLNAGALWVYELPSAILCAIGLYQLRGKEIS